MQKDIVLVRSLIFYVATLLFFGVGAITTIGLEWYAGLMTPAWTPPELLVAFIWGALFLLTAYSIAIFWEKSSTDESSFKSVLSLYLANAALILLWNYLFFGVHQLAVAFYVALAVGASVVLLMARLWKNSRTSALLLIPYFAWMVFALFFTYSVLTLNP